MKTRQRTVSKDRLAITQRNTRSKKATENGRRESSLPIPIDLIIEIFSRLPVKSIARCRCVSKPWASILRCSDFTELFLTRSSARPKLLFASKTNGELLFFSSPQPHNPDENSFPVLVNYYMKFSVGAYSPICRHVHGLVCLTNRWINRTEETLPLIYNLSTGQSLLIPKVKRRWVGVEVRFGIQVRSLLGYDPIDKQFKLLSMTYGAVNKVHNEHQVLTLGTRNHSWRMIKCSRPHYSLQEGICIDGVVYYTASGNSSSYCSMVVCFEVRSEKFRFIQVTETFIRYDRTLINYNGKLGLLGFERSSEVNVTSRSIEFCFLEDAQKDEWSKHTYVLPVSWQNIVGTSHLYVVGMTRTNEIVLAAQYQTVHFYIFYYNIERKTIRRLQIQGMESFKNKKVYIFLDHVDDLKLMQLF